MISQLNFYYNHFELISQNDEVWTGETNELLLTGQIQNLQQMMADKMIPEWETQYIEYDHIKDLIEKASQIHHSSHQPALTARRPKKL